VKQKTELGKLLRKKLAKNARNSSVWSANGKSNARAKKRRDLSAKSQNVQFAVL